MDQFPEICRKVTLLRDAFSMPGAPKEVPTLEFSEWLVAEVERLRKIEDAFRTNTKLNDDGSATVFDIVQAIQVMIDNPRPGTEG